MTALKVRDVRLRYVTGGYEVTPVRDLSFEADDGELVLLLGASGCGKTTLLSALASLLAPAAGSIKLDDIEVTTLGARHLPNIGDDRSAWSSSRSTSWPA